MDTPIPFEPDGNVNPTAGNQYSSILADVLIIDDSHAIRQVVRAVLESIGYRAVEAENGRVALAQLASGLFPRLVICDINMPIMDGLSFITAFRKLPGHARTPVVLLTSEAKNGSLLKGDNAGATAWMTKPFTPANLRKLVQEIFSQ
ncbi:MAG: response regulator [Sulfurimicrobium sp.]|nr:response regulator [Sulfurimicrobium sp.]MDP1704770.1 response regulator [Sulfurimicrobium sp.]MDP3688114.1 response regulator [Sulfurimicrobium sp.]